MNSSKLSKIKHKLTPSSHSSSSNTQIPATNHHHSSSSHASNNNNKHNDDDDTTAFNTRSLQDNRTYSVSSDALFNDDFGTESPSHSHSPVAPTPPLRPTTTATTTATTSHNSHNSHNSHSIPTDIPHTPVFVSSSSPVTTSRPELSFVHKPHDDEFIFLDTPSFRDVNDSASSMSHLGTPRSSNHNVSSVHNTPHGYIPANHSHTAAHNSCRDSVSSSSDSAGSFEEKPGLLTKLKVYSDDDDDDDDGNDGNDDSSIDGNRFTNIGSSIHSRSKNLKHSPAPSQSTFAQSKVYRADHIAHSQYFYNNRIPSDTREEVVTNSSGSKNLFQSLTGSSGRNAENSVTKPLSGTHANELESPISSTDSGFKHASNKPASDNSSSTESNNSAKSTTNLSVTGPSSAHNGQEYPSLKGSNLTLTLSASHTESAGSVHNNNTKTNANNFYGHYQAYNKSSGSLISRGSRSRSTNIHKNKSKSKTRPPTPNAQIVGQTTPMPSSRQRSRSHTLGAIDPLTNTAKNDADSGSAKSVVNRSLANSILFDVPMPVGQSSQISRSNSSNVVNQSNDMISLSSGSADAVNSPQVIVNEFSRQISNMNILTTADYDLITAQEDAKEAENRKQGNAKQINDDECRCNVKSTSTLIHLEDYKEYNSIDSYNKLLTDHELQSFAQNHIPKETIMLSKYFLHKIVNSKSKTQQFVKHSERNINVNRKGDFKIRGEFVTSKLFIPRDIWTLSLLTIRDAKIKQNILNDLIIFLKEFMNKIFFEHVDKLNVNMTNGSLLYYQKLLSAFNVYEKANDTNLVNFSAGSTDNVNGKTGFVNSNENSQTKDPFQSNNNNGPLESYTGSRFRSSSQAQENDTLPEIGNVKSQASPSPTSLTSLSQQQQQQQQQQQKQQHQQQQHQQSKPPSAKSQQHHRRFSSFHFYRKKSKTKSRLDLSTVASVDGSNSNIHINKDCTTNSASGSNNNHNNNSNSNIDGSTEEFSKISSEANTTATTATNATTIMNSSSISTTETPLTNASKSPSLSSFVMHSNSANTNNTNINNGSKDAISDLYNDKVNGITSLEYHRVLSSLFEIVAKLTNYAMFLKYSLQQQENHASDGNNNKHSKWKHHNKAAASDDDKETKASTVDEELAEKLQMTEKVLKFLSKYVIRFILIDVMGLVGDYMRFLSEIFKSGNSDEGYEDIAMSSPARSTFAQ